MKRTKSHQHDAARRTVRSQSIGDRTLGGRAFGSEPSVRAEELILTPQAARGEPRATEHHHRLDAIIRADPELMRLLERLRTLKLPQWRLVAGCLYQTVWNVLTGRPPRTGIKDYDLIYFDAADLSWEAEDAVIRRVAAATTDCPGMHGPGPVEVRNQARVHLWFESRFGCAYPQLSCADEALRYYASIVHAVGVRLEDDGRLDIAAPFGLDDLFAMVIRPNHALDNAASHVAKAQRARATWPEVVVLPWEMRSCYIAAPDPSA